MLCRVNIYIYKLFFSKIKYFLSCNSLTEKRFPPKNKQQKTEIQFVTKFSPCNLCRVNPLHQQINRGSLKKKKNKQKRRKQHVDALRVSSGTSQLIESGSDAAD